MTMPTDDPNEAARRLTWELLADALRERRWRMACFIVSGFPQVAAIQREVQEEKAASPGPLPKAKASPFVYALR